MVAHSGELTQKLTGPGFFCNISHSLSPRLDAMASCDLCRKGLREQFVAKSNSGECLVSASPTVFFSQHAVMLKWTFASKWFKKRILIRRGKVSFGLVRAKKFCSFVYLCDVVRKTSHFILLFFFVVILLQ